MARRPQIVHIILELRRKRIVVEPLIRGETLGVGIGAAQIDGEIVELEFAHELRVDQLAAELRGGVALQQHVATHVDVVGADLNTGFLDGVVHIDVGKTDLVIAEFGPNAEQAVDNATEFRGGKVEILIRLKLQRAALAHRRAAGKLLFAGLGLPIVRQTGGEHETDARVTHVPGAAARHVAAPVHRDIVVAEDHVGFGVGQGRGDVLQLAQREIATHGQRLTSVLAGLNAGGQTTGAVIIAGPVLASARIYITELAGGGGVGANAAAHREEGFLGHGPGRQVDDAAAEFAGEIDRIAFLHNRRSQYRGREQIERHHAAQRIRRRDRQAVQQRQRVTLTQTTHIDITAANNRQAGDALQGAGDVAFTRTRDVGLAQHRHHFAAQPHGVGDATADNDDFAAAAAGDRNVDWFFFRRRFGSRSRFGCRRGRRLCPGRGSERHHHGGRK